MCSNSPPILVDVRSEGEYRVSTIPGAIRLADVHKNVTHGATVVCFCTVGMRSSLEARMLARRHPNCTVYSMDGVLCWSHIGGSFHEPKTGTPTDKLHVFSRQFAQMLPEHSEPAAVWYSGRSVGMAGAVCDVAEKVVRSTFHRLFSRAWRYGQSPQSR
eukprot:scaffold41771_cov32-Tisochrysis_lutea.AAC.6